MVSATVNGVTTTYVYDDAGNRVGETTGGVTTFYLTDDHNPTGYAQPIEQKASATAPPSVTYVIGDHVLAQVDASGNVSYLLTDGHGSTRALTNAAGAVTQTFNYTAFGGALGFNPSAAGTISDSTVFLFGGDAVYDPASGLYLNGDGTRDRLPGAGGFIEADPPGWSNNQDPVSLHRYLYANAAPIDGYDPSGHEDLNTQSTMGYIEAKFNSFRIAALRFGSVYARRMLAGLTLVQSLASRAVDKGYEILAWEQRLQDSAFTFVGRFRVDLFLQKVNDSGEEVNTLVE
jgi:YD repeat-containing protein